MPESRLATVAEVLDGHRVVLNRGMIHGVEEGDRFLVFGMGDEIKDPETGESLGKLEIVRGIGRVSHVQERMCTLRSDKKYKTPGKTVRRVTGSTGTSISAILGKQEVVETEGEEFHAAPFDSVEINDKAKPI